MQITALVPSRRDPERVEVYVDGEARGTLAAELVLREGLRTGLPLTEEALEALDREDEPFRVRAAALNLLAVRPRSRTELRRRLRAKGFGAPVVDGCLDRLEALRLVDDRAFAEAFARHRARLRPQGRRRTVRELLARGVDEDTAEAAVEGGLEEEGASEVEQARRAAAKWRPRAGEPGVSARRRLYGYLARRGFAADAIQAVMDEVVPDVEG